MISIQKCFIFNSSTERKGTTLGRKNILRTIYHQLKNEISRTEHLENTVADMNKEASRLAVHHINIDNVVC